MAEPLESHLLRQIEHSRDFFWHRLRWRALRNHLPSDRPVEVVDIGAGAGLLGDFMQRALPGARYRFVEPIEPLRLHLGGRYGPESDYGSKSSYDEANVIVLLDVLEHQEDDRQFLEELLRKVSAGTLILITVPALMSLWSQWDVALHHYRRYDKAMLRKCIDGLPVEVREISYLFPEMVPLGLVRKFKRSSSTDVDEAHFPDLPKWLNDLLYTLGKLPLRLRRWSPLGTSLYAVLVRR